MIFRRTTENAKKKRQNYSIAFKASAVDFALKFDISKAARQYGVARSCIIDWMKLKGALEERVDDGFSEKKRLEGGGRNCQDTDFDVKLGTWVREKRLEKLRVTRQMIQQRAKTMNTDPKFTVSGLS